MGSPSPIPVEADRFHADCAARVERMDERRVAAMRDRANEILAFTEPRPEPGWKPCRGCVDGRVREGDDEPYCEWCTFGSTKAVHVPEPEPCEGCGAEGTEVCDCDHGPRELSGMELIERDGRRWLGGGL